MPAALFIAPAEIRSRFAAAMSAMYRNEVPKYGTLVDLVADVNRHALEQDPQLQKALRASHNLQRLSDERHGAIRLGLPYELSTMRRLFAVMDMHPVGYYDLSEAGIPVHSTAFRPLIQNELNKNPFRIFTSLLRLDLIEDRSLREKAHELLRQRNIFSAALLELIERNEREQGLDATAAEQFVEAALETFRWHPKARVDRPTYLSFLLTHPLIADIVCFKGPHINHLTPRTLDIDRAHAQMIDAGLEAKAIIEGPPRRQHPILLRQTSFKALSESTRFTGQDTKGNSGNHRARFGEIEQRGMALTLKGRSLYDELLARVRAKAGCAEQDPASYRQQLAVAFEAFPDDLQAIHQQRLAYFRFQVAEGKVAPNADSLDRMVSDGTLQLIPVTYEDFLPISAAGIFQSNLARDQMQHFKRSSAQKQFEQDLGCPVNNEFELYASIQAESLQRALVQLGYSGTKLASLLEQME